MDTNVLTYILIALVVLVVLFFGIRFFLKNKKVRASLKNKSGLDIERLVSLFGGKENIEGVSSNGSKLNVIVKMSKEVQVDSIKQLGASGIVQNQNKFIVIFGKMSEVIEKEIKLYIK